MQFTKS